MPICIKCERSVSFNSDEFREWLFVQDGQGEIVAAVCPDCQTHEERADVQRLLVSLRAERDRP